MFLPIKEIIWYVYKQKPFRSYENTIVEAPINKKKYEEKEKNTPSTTMRAQNIKQVISLSFRRL